MAYQRSRFIQKAGRYFGFFLGLTACTLFSAQAEDLRLGATYQCPNGSAFRVFTCSGSGNTEQCDVEASIPGQPPQRGMSPRQQVMTLLPVCHLQTPGEAQAATKGAGTPANPQADANGFKIGDEVSVATAGGWYVARILRANGSAYFVNLGAVEVWKTYPTELRRRGPLTDIDRAHGLFALHDKVQANVEGKWVDGEIVAEMGMEYQVALAGNRSAWAGAQNLRRLAVSEKPAPKAGEPPKAGLKRCAGKIEGRYASGSLQITFRSGKALWRDLTGESEFECWMDAEKIYLHSPGESTPDMPIDINDDGTLQTPFGEIRKKGK